MPGTLTSPALDTTSLWARLDAFGRLDQGFDGDGKQTVDLGNSEDRAYGVAGDGQGRVVVGGFSGQLQSGTRPDFAVVVFDTNGQSSTTFGDSGVVLTNLGRFPFQTSENANDVMAIQPDGKFLVAGSGSTVITGFDFVVLRYNADGSLDPTFGEGGIVVVDFGYTNDYATGVAVDSHGRVVVAGYSIDNQLGPSDDAVVWVVRLKADGKDRSQLRR